MRKNTGIRGLRYWLERNKLILLQSKQTKVNQLKIIALFWNLLSLKRMFILDVHLHLLVRRIFSLTLVLDIQGPVVVIYFYQLINNEVKVDKVEFQKLDA